MVNQRRVPGASRGLRAAAGRRPASGARRAAVSTGRQHGPGRRERWLGPRGRRWRWRRRPCGLWLLLLPPLPTPLARACRVLRRPRHTTVCILRPVGRQTTEPSHVETRTRTEPGERRLGPRGRRWGWRRPSGCCCHRCRPRGQGLPRPPTPKLHKLSAGARAGAGWAGRRGRRQQCCCHCWLARLDSVRGRRATTPRGEG